MVRSAKTRRRIRALVAAVLASALIVALAAGTSWRLAVVAGLASGAIALTRLRYAALVAVGLLTVTLALAETGRSAGSDHRDAPAAHKVHKPR